MFSWFKKNTPVDTYSACFTGHRPQHFSFGFNENHVDCKRIKNSIEDAVDMLIDLGVNTFITGMALGVDMWSAEIVLNKRRFNRNIKLIAAIPCKGQENKWSKQYKDRYYNILSKCNEVIYISNTYTNSCMQNRNQYMVDNSDYIIAVYDGGSGGTGNTVQYARSIKKRIVIIDVNNCVIRKENF